MSSNSDSMDVTEFDGTEAPVPPKSGSGGFLIVLIVAAVLPFSLAMGMKLRATTVPQAEIDPVEPVETVITPNRIELEEDDHRIALRDRRRGDTLFLEGHYDTALQFYSTLGSADSLQMPPDLLLRVGLCHEALGEFDEALTTYRRIVESDESPMTTAATLGQARIWLRLSEFAQAEPLIRRLLLRSGDHEVVPADTIPELTALFGLCVVEQILPDAQPDRSRQEILPPIANIFDGSLEYSLRAIFPKSESDRKPADVPNPHPEAEHTDIHVADALAVEVEMINRQLLPIKWSAEGVSCRELMDHVVDVAGWSLSWTEEARQRASERTINEICVADLSPKILLTIGCREIDCHWSFNILTKSVSIHHDSTDPKGFIGIRKMSESTIDQILDSFPNERLSSSLIFALAELAESDKRHVDAAELYARLVTPKITPIVTRAAYNGALEFHRTGDIARACKLLETVVFGAPGHEMHTRSLILYGRLLIELGMFADAVHQLKRAADSRAHPDDQARAAVYCALAFLMAEKPEEATHVLLDHRLQMRDKVCLNAAALLTSVAICRAVSSSQHDEYTYLYEAIVAIEPDAEWLGPSGQLILGEAMSIAELHDQMAELYEKVLQGPTSELVKREINLRLAVYYRNHRRWEDAGRIWKTYFATDGKARMDCGLQLAELALDEKDPQACLEMCKKLMDLPGVSRNKVLKLAGRAYELAKEPNLAAQCYAGQWPVQ